MVTKEELATLHRMALDAVRAVLTAVDAKPSDVLRAAELIARMEAPSGVGAGDAHSATDAELLAYARGHAPGARGAAGEGGTPRERGPGDSSAGAVPSQAHSDPGSPIAIGGAPIAIGGAPIAIAGAVPRETPVDPFLVRKKGPDGTQKGPVISGGPPAHIASDTQIGNDPPRKGKRRPPEPWE